MQLNRLTGILIATVLLLITQGCGFQLKGTSAGSSLNIPVAVQSVSETQDMQFRLERAFLALGADVVESIENRAELEVFLQQEEVARRVTARDSTGRAIEYLLRLKVTVEYRWHEQDPQNKTFSTQQTYRYNKEQLLATHRQERLLLSEMQEQLAQQIASYFSRTVNSPSSSTETHAH